MKKHLLTAILSLLLIAPLLIHGQDPVSCDFNYGTYSERSPSHLKGLDYASGVIDNKIYLTCGAIPYDYEGNENDSTTYDDRLSVYDPVTDTWDTTGARIPVARMFYGAGNMVLDGMFYAIGGVHWLPAEPWWIPIPIARVDVYDPVSDQWEQKANLPIPVGASGICSLEGKIYVTGGISTDLVPLNTLYCYDPESDSWTELAGMATPRSFHVSVAMEGKIYVISGDDSQGVGGGTRTCEVYDPQTDQWSSIASLHGIRIFAAACAVDGEIYFFGGVANPSNDPLNRVYKYNPQANTWLFGDHMPVSWQDHVAVPIGREIYLMGGWSSPLQNFDSAVRVYELSDLRLDAMIPDDTIYGDTIELDLSDYFSHVDGGEITYSFCLDDSGILEASVDGSMLTVTAVATGDAEVSILAESGEDQMGDSFMLNVLTTGIDEICEIPPALQIYPNPSNGMATLAYSVESRGIVRLEVCDLTGKRIYIPLNEYRLPGTYEYSLNTADMMPGIYFCRMNTSSGSITVKLMVEH